MGTDEKPKLTPSCAISGGSHTWAQRTAQQFAAHPSLQRSTAVCTNSVCRPRRSPLSPALQACRALKPTRPCPGQCPPRPSSEEGRVALHQQPVPPVTPPAPGQRGCAHPLSILQPGRSGGQHCSLSAGGGRGAWPALTNLLIKNLGRA